MKKQVVWGCRTVVSAASSASYRLNAGSGRRRIIGHILLIWQAPGSEPHHPIYKTFSGTFLMYPKCSLFRSRLSELKFRDPPFTHPNNKYSHFSQKMLWYQSHSGTHSDFIRHFSSNLARHEKTECFWRGKVGRADSSASDRLNAGSGCRGLIGYIFSFGEHRAPNPTTRYTKYFQERF